MNDFHDRARARDAALKLRGMLTEVRNAPKDARDFLVFDKRDDWADLGVSDDDAEGVDLSDDALLDHHIAQAGAAARVLGHVEDDDTISGGEGWDALLGGAGDDALLDGVVGDGSAKWPNGSMTGTPYQKAKQRLENPRPPPNIGTMEIPYGVDIEANVAEAREHYLDPVWFYNKVRPGGPWDYKAHTKRRVIEVNGDTINPYEDFGNVHYGIVGRAAGFAPQVLLRMAGRNQESGKNAAPGFGHSYSRAPYGDDPRDGAAIRLGIDKYQKQYRKP